MERKIGTYTNYIIATFSFKNIIIVTTNQYFQVTLKKEDLESIHDSP